VPSIAPPSSASNCFRDAPAARARVAVAWHNNMLTHQGTHSRTCTEARMHMLTYTHPRTRPAHMHTNEKKTNTHMHMHARTVNAWTHWHLHARTNAGVHARSLSWWRRCRDDRRRVSNSIYWMPAHLLPAVNNDSYIWIVDIFIYTCMYLDSIVYVTWLTVVKPVKCHVQYIKCQHAIWMMIHLYMCIWIIESYINESSICCLDIVEAIFELIDAKCPTQHIQHQRFH